MMNCRANSVSHVVAEGIEHEDQCDHLRALNCDAGQGHLFAKPLIPRECHGSVEERARARLERPREAMPRSGSETTLVPAIRSWTPSCDRSRRVVCGGDRRAVVGGAVEGCQDHRTCVQRSGDARSQRVPRDRTWNCRPRLPLHSATTRRWPRLGEGRLGRFAGRRPSPPLWRLPRTAGAGSRRRGVRSQHGCSTTSPSPRNSCTPCRTTR